MSVAHLDEEDRSVVLGLVLEEVLAWVRGLSGTSALRALLVVDEVYGFLPPHPANPPTKRPLVALMKQARAYGVSVVIATQNPMDLDYRALSNAGLWFVGRLQTDADRARVVEGMAGGGAGAGPPRALLTATLKRLAKRWFLVRNVHTGESACLVQPRHAISWMKGPMTRAELRRARGETEGRQSGRVEVLDAAAVTIADGFRKARGGDEARASRPDLRTSPVTGPLRVERAERVDEDTARVTIRHGDVSRAYVVVRHTDPYVLYEVDSACQRELGPEGMHLVLEAAKPLFA